MGPKTTHRRFPDLTQALAAAEGESTVLAESAPRRAVDAKYRRFEPSEQVVARLEVAGPQRVLPSVTGGLDVHGDGSLTAYTGRVRRQAVAPRKRESAVAALRRALQDA